MRQICRAMKRIASLAVFGAVMASLPALACSCMGPGPPCEVAWKAATVFAEVVVDKTVTNDANLLGRAVRNPVKVSFTVERVLTGMSKGTKDAEIFTGMGGGDCGYHFERGVRYIVYSYKEPDGRLSTGICSRTKLLADAVEDLAYFDGLVEAKPLARVFGFAFDPQLPRIQGASGHYQPTGLKGVSVTIKGEKGTREYKTGTDGRFDFVDLEPGSYRTDASLTGYVLPSLPTPVNIPAKGCAEVWIPMAVDRQVRGRVVDEQGRPAATLTIALLSTTLQGENTLPFVDESGVSSTDGYYVIPHVRAGEYYVGVSLDRSPNSLENLYC